MKKILSLCLVFTSILFGAVSTSTISSINSSVKSIDTTQLTNTEANAKASDEVSNFLKTTTTGTGIEAENYANQDTKIQNLDVYNGGLNNKKESIYAKYFSEILKKENKSEIFGLNTINNSGIEVLPVTIDKEYLLSFGDVVSLKVWSDLFTGESESTKVSSLEIGKNGTIFVPDVGSFYVIGKSIKSVQNEVISAGKKKLKYFNAEIGLEKIREIKVFVSGEVNKPGYVLATPYSNLFNLFNRAMGITEKASLRNIKVIRNSQEIKIDLYPYLMGNKKIEELKLQDGDTIFVPVANNFVVVEGEVNKNGIYELGDEKDYKSIINLAGGFTKFSDKVTIQSYFVDESKITIKSSNLNDKIVGNIFKITVNKIDDNNRNDLYFLGAIVNPGVYSYEDNITFKDLLKKSGGYIKESSENYATIIRGKETKEVINFNPQLSNPKLALGDEIYVYNYTDINNRPYANIQGAVVNVGSYEIYEGSRILNLLYSARGLDEKQQPYMNRADLFRIDENGRLKVYKVNLNKVLAGDETENIIVKRNDVIKVYTYDEIIKYDDIYIYGEVREPGKYRYYENMTLEDLVFYAKGLINKADNNIVIARNDENTRQMLEFTVDIERNPDFKILEGDSIFVRKKVDWLDSKIVKVEGFVKYPGSYQLNEKETLTSLIKRAGGFKADAYPTGLQLNRASNKVSMDETTKEEKVITVMERVSNIEYNSKTKEFVRDIELKDGDTVYVPENPTFVKIEGEVYNPSYVIYDKKLKNYKDYISSAGGYKETAYKKKTFVIKANGKTYENPKDTNIEPGDTIYVPLDSREKKGFDRAMEAFKGTLEIVSTIALIIVLF